MPAERVLQVSIVSMCVLSTLMLGMGERNVTLPVLAVVLGFGSLLLTDFKGWICLNSALGNLAAVVAVAVSAVELNQLEADERVLAVANLMIYLQFILFFKRKSEPTYWLLAVVSLLQTAVAAALNFSLLFGALLVLYLFLAVHTLLCFYLWREGRPTDREPAATGWWRRRTRWTGHELVEGRGGAPGGAVARMVGLVSLVSLLLTVMVFVVVPRVSQDAWHPATFRITQIGFTNQVTLGQMGEVIHSGDVVMQVQLTDALNGDPVELIEPLLMRGTAVSQYEQGKWRPGDRQRSPTEGPLPRARELSSLGGVVRQRIQIEPLDNSTLFSVFPPVQDQSLLGVRYDPYLGRLSRSGGIRAMARRMTYELFTTGIRNRLQLPITPLVRPRDEKDDLLQMPPRDAAGRDPLAGLRRVADETTADLAPDDHVGRARALEHLLRRSGQFRYSLLSVERDPRLDPLEDFVTLHREAHCEYFASALVMMLRSQGIPARLVLGYSGGEYNSVGRYYQFEQLHAHSWVEAWLAPDKIPSVPLVPADWEPLARQNGAWLRLDPTPSGSDSGLAAQSIWYTAYRRSLDLAQYLWANHVLGMDARWQQEAVYQPIGQQLQAALGRFFSPRQWRRGWAELETELAERLGGDAAESSRGLWAARGLLGTLAALAAALLWYAGRWGWQRWRRRASAATGAAQRPVVVVDFYQRLERLFARQALVRLPAQTQREFAAAAAGQLAEVLAVHQAAGLPRRVVDAYYRVRFGGRPLDNAERQAVEQALDQLETAFRAADRPAGV